MPLVVLNVAYPFARIGPDASDEAEKIVSQLDAALIRAGHESVVMACEGSVIEGILLETRTPSEQVDETERLQIYDQYRFTLHTFLERWPIDLVHMHGVDFYEYLPPPEVPVLVTLHSPPHHYPESVFHLGRPHTFLNFASAQQRENCPPCANLLPEFNNDDTAGLQMIDEYISTYEKLVNDFRAAETPRIETTEAFLAAR